MKLSLDNYCFNCLYGYVSDLGDLSCSLQLEQHKILQKQIPYCFNHRTNTDEERKAKITRVKTRHCLEYIP